MVPVDVEPMMAHIARSPLVNGVPSADEDMKEIENNADDEAMRQLELDIHEEVCLLSS
jgi:hypothetical protein